MKSLSLYINGMNTLSSTMLKEQYDDMSIDVDNIKVKINSWFSSDENGQTSFNDFVTKCKENHRIEPMELDSYYSSFNKSKEFVDFINDDINGTGTIDYKDAFMNIVRQCAGV